MVDLSMSTMICTPVKQVFDFMSVPENDFQWQYGTLASARLSEGDSAMGTFFRSIGHLAGRRVESTFEVTEYEPDKKYGFKSLSGPLHSQTSYTFETADGCTRVTVSTQARLIHSFQAGDDVLEKKMKKQLRENLVMLKDLLEAGEIMSSSNTVSPAR